MRDPAASSRNRGNVKLSEPFRARLNRLGSRTKIRAILLLRTGAVPPGVARGEAVATLRQSAQQGLGEIDAILERHGGRRLAEAPDALGSVPVETTAGGITALAGCAHVKAILEDQAIRALRT